MKMIMALTTALMIAGAGAATNASAQNRRYQFDIPRQPLDLALKDFAQQTGLHVARFSDSIDGATLVGPINGSLTSYEALENMLRSQGLRYRLANERTVAIVKATTSKAEPQRPIVLAQASQAPQSSASAQQSAGEDSASDIDEITVTATRQSQSISKVPMSITAFSQADMDARGVRSMADIAAATPGVTYSVGGTGASSIAIRGLASSAGSATTGVYIDDTPIQSRSTGYGSGNVYPTVFDLERVEVLRGPQGTLFGAGSQGGTIRFIQPEPSLTTYSGVARAEFSSIQNGDIGYEVGYATGGPIVQDKLGFRISGFFRHSGGWIDNVWGTATAVDSTGLSGPDSVRLAREGSVSDANWGETKAFRLALSYAPTEKITITPSVSYNSDYSNSIGGTVWPGLSDFKTGDLVNVVWPATVDADRVALHLKDPTHYPFNDRFVLSALRVNWDMGPMTMISNTSYFDREMNTTNDYTTTTYLAYSGRKVPRPGDSGYTTRDNTQENFVQEIRFQPLDTEGRINWVVGAYFEKRDQVADQHVYSNHLGQDAVVLGVPEDGAPFGPGYSAYTNYYGQALGPDGMTWHGFFKDKDEQFALFAQTDYKLTGRLKLTTGLRYSRLKNSSTADYAGPENNLNAPKGRACTPGTSGASCVPVAIGQYAPGEGPFAYQFLGETYDADESSVTPKIGLSFQATERDLYYLEVAKGYRGGGAQPRLPPLCDDGLTRLGFVDANGRPQGQTSYDPDTVWSYEIGAKNRLFGGRLGTAASVYMLKWKDILSSINVSECAQRFFTNVGEATGRGFDLQADIRLLDNLTLVGIVGYNKISFDETVRTGSAIIYSKDAPIPGSGAPWVGSLAAIYDFVAFGSRDAYARLDYLYSGEPRPTGATDPKSANFDPMLIPDEASKLLHARVGVKFGSADVSLFVRNLTNELPYVGYSRFRNAAIYTARTFTPRTFGVTLSYRY